MVLCATCQRHKWHVHALPLACSCHWWCPIATCGHPYPKGGRLAPHKATKVAHLGPCPLAPCPKLWARTFGCTQSQWATMNHTANHNCAVHVMCRITVNHSMPPEPCANDCHSVTVQRPDVASVVDAQQLLMHIRGESVPQLAVASRCVTLHMFAVCTQTQFFCEITGLLHHLALSGASMP